MARVRSTSDFAVPVEGIGTFMFARRTMRDEIKISVERARLLDGVEPEPWLSLVTTWICTITVLASSMPEGFGDPMELDPSDNDSYTKLKAVFDALYEKELSFRQKRGSGEPAQGQGSGADGAVPVAP